MKQLRHWAVHLAALVLDTFAAITGFFYSKKYAAIVKGLGLRPADNSGDQPGLLIVQIDGLAHEHLLQALDQNRLPSIQRLLRKGEFTAVRWRCGLPSTTPASQAGILFGNNDDIPAFRWYDKTRGVSLACSVPGVVALVQSRISRGHTGLLVGGASYVNLYDGGAASSLFTVSDLRPRRFFEDVRGLGVVVLFLLNPLRTLYMLFLIVKEYSMDVWQRASSRLKGRPYLPFAGVVPLARIISSVVTRAIETFAVLVDIYRGVPAIYANYYAYDESAHHFGVDSLVARQVLRDIDRRIGQIDRLRRSNLSRPYSLVLLSDHGMTPAVPFNYRFAGSLGQYIAEQLGESVLLVEHAGGEQQTLVQARFLLDELRSVEKNLRPRAARVARRVRLLVQRRLAVHPNETPDWDLRHQYDVVVKSSGSLAHVYLNLTRRRIDLSEVSAAFPSLVARLLEQEGIWLVVAREGERTLVMSRGGVLTLGGEGGPRVEGHNPLERVPEPAEAAEQIRRLVSFPSCGDLVLLGDYDPQMGEVVCFENQWASHGGLGGPQDGPFIVYPSALDWNLTAVHNSRDMYPLLAAQRATGPPQTSPSDQLKTGGA